MVDSSGARRSARNLAIVLGMAAALAALGLFIGFYRELPAAAHRLFGSLARPAVGEGCGQVVGDGAAWAVAAAQSFCQAALDAVTANEPGALVFLGLLVLAAGALLVLPVPSRQLLAVAGTSLTEARHGGALWLAAAGALAVAAGAPFLDYQGGPADRLKMVLSVGLGAATLVGMLLAVALPALTFSREAETRSIYVIATKPVPRWAVSGGKLLGVGLALAAALAAMGLGASAAARLAMGAEARRAEDPELVRLNLDFRRDRFPEPAPSAGRAAARPRAVRLSRGASQTCVLDVPEKERGRRWLVLRLHLQPADPLLPAVRARIDCGEWGREVSVLRDRPVDLPVPADLARDGRLAVRVAPTADLQGNVYPLVADPRGAVALAVVGDGLEVTLAKALVLLWFQLMVVAAVTLAAAGTLSFPVAVVAGAATAIFGQLSGLAVGLLEQSAELGGREAAGSALAQMLRKLAAGELALLPDFDKASGADFLARGDFIPWGLLAGGALTLLLLRALPAALVGALAFSRREVGN